MSQTTRSRRHRTDIRMPGHDGRAGAPGQPGVFARNGQERMLGDWNKPAASARVMHDGWRHTGDIGVRDADGSLTFVDRRKAIIIKKFGENDHGRIRRHAPIEVDVAVADCSTRLADNKGPRAVVGLGAPLPRLATGKLAKMALRKQCRAAAPDAPKP